MSVFTTKSTILTNRDASPPLLNNPELSRGGVKSIMAGVQTEAAVVTAATTMRLFQVPSNARLDELYYCMDTLGTSTLDIAAWYPTSIPQGGANAPAASLAGTLISSSFAVDGIAGHDLGIAWTEAMSLPSVLSIVKRSQPLWQLLGLSNDPGIPIDLGFSVAVATTEQGYVALRAQYVD